jgi:histidyl-tRNA synthetase
VQHSQRDAISVKIDNSPARGTRDLLPADVAVRDHVLESITTVYRRFGYQRIETPALEDITRLMRSPPPPRYGTWSTLGCGTT